MSLIKETIAQMSTTFAEKYPQGKPISHSVYTSSRGTAFVSQMVVTGAATGFVLGTMGYASDARKHYRTLLEDLAEPQKKITVPKVSEFSIHFARTKLLLSKGVKGAAHGLIYGSTVYYLRDVWGYSDRTAIFGGGIAFTLAGRCLCKFFSFF